VNEPALESTLVRLQRSAYARRLGISCGPAADGVRVSLPWKDDNTNTGLRLHGGAAEALLEEPSGPPRAAWPRAGQQAPSAYTTSADGGRGPSSTLGLDLSFITPLAGDCRALSCALGRSGEVATGCVEGRMIDADTAAIDAECRRRDVAVVGTITYRLRLSPGKTQ